MFHSKILYGDFTDKMTTESDTPRSNQTVADYRALRTQVLRHVRGYDRLNSTSYHALFNDGLLPLQQFEQQHPHIVQEFSLTASSWSKRNHSADQLLKHAAVREGRQDVFARLHKLGAQIQPVAGAFVQTDPEKGGLGSGATGEEYKVQFADKTKQLCTALVGMGFDANDLAVYRGGVPDRSLRQAPYTLIDLPRIQKQIAVCDQIGEITFVARTPLPLADWAALSKEALKAQPDMQTIRYDSEGKWLNAVQGALLDDGRLALATTPKVKLAVATEKPLLTETGIVRWMQLYKEHDDEVKDAGKGKYPSRLSAIVWDKDTNGKWVGVNESWNALNIALQKGSGRGLPGDSSLAKLKQEHKMVESRTKPDRTLTSSLV